MDIWMVAVAAGAGYLSQHFKKTKSQIPSDSSADDPFSLKPDPPNPPPEKKQLFHRFIKREKLKQVDSEMGSTSEFEGEKGVIHEEGNNVFSASTQFRGIIGSDGVSETISHNSFNPKSRMLLRSGRTNRRLIRPLSSLESCVMAQLYTEHVEMKEYMQQTVRPFLVTDGRKVISKANGDAFINQIYTEENTLLPSMGALEISGTRSKHFNLLRGPSDADAALLLCLGMSFGIISSFIANKQEIEKLNGLLKQTKNLVQDLEEELEMKDSLIMKELIFDEHKSQRMDSDHSVPHLEQPTTSSNIEKEKDESFSKIEAELEAELEMLEMSMSSSTLERRISNFVEHDPDFDVDVAEGELRADMVLDLRATADEDGTGSTGPTHSANYAVSPKELSLRLHEVLQSQLEERIRELEMEIKTKQNWKDFLSEDEDEKEKENKHVDEAVVLNLSGEALDAYNEACNEFSKFDESDEERTPVCHENEDDFEDVEMEKMLIKHFVEKARQGSPMVLNAQRLLFSE